MVNHEQAYEDLGLTIDANRQQVEKRYHNVIRRLHTKKQLGTLSMIDEMNWKSAHQAYRFILDTEINRQIEDYREKHYGKYKKYSGIAEKLDHILFYYNYHIVGCILLLIFIIIGVTGFRHYQEEQRKIASMPIPDLSIMMAIDDQPDFQISFEPNALEQKLLAIMPEWKHIESKQNTWNNDNTLSLITENPDLYILNKDQFIKLLRLGYLRKLDEWDSFGVNLGYGKLASLLSLDGKQMIAAVSVNALHPEHALQFIDRFYDESVFEHEVKKLSIKEP